MVSIVAAHALKAAMLLMAWAGTVIWVLAMTGIALALDGPETGMVVVILLIVVAAGVPWWLHVGLNLIYAAPINGVTKPIRWDVWGYLTFVLGVVACELLLVGMVLGAAMKDLRF
jgi:hypothetical protein